MNIRMLTVLAVLAAASSTSYAQDLEYIRAMDRAQQDRPAELTSSARIAPPNEQGTRLTIRGRVLNVDGSPAADAVIFAYHTDREGLYDQKGKGPHSWRLRGWAKADADGRFLFETIRPGAYPDSNTPPHVHFTAFLTNRERFHSPDYNLPAKPPASGPEEVTVTLRLKRGDKF